MSVRTAPLNRLEANDGREESLGASLVRLVEDLETEEVLAARTRTCLHAHQRARKRQPRASPMPSMP